MVLFYLLIGIIFEFYIHINSTEEIKRRYLDTQSNAILIPLVLIVFWPIYLAIFLFKKTHKTNTGL